MEVLVSDFSFPALDKRQPVQSSVRNGRRTEDERRTFLKRAVNWIAAAFALLVAGAGVGSLVPPRAVRREDTIVPLLDEDEAPRRGAREVPFTYRKNGREVTGRVILVAGGEGLLALSPSCTHLGCFVVWRADLEEFLCPCHGGRYDRTGKNIAGPPPRPLTRFPLTRREGMLYVKVPT